MWKLTVVSSLDDFQAFTEDFTVMLHRDSRKQSDYTKLFGKKVLRHYIFSSNLTKTQPEMREQLHMTFPGMEEIIKNNTEYQNIHNF